MYLFLNKKIPKYVFEIKTQIRNFIPLLVQKWVFREHTNFFNFQSNQKLCNSRQNTILIDIYIYIPII